MSEMRRRFLGLAGAGVLGFATGVSAEDRQVSAEQVASSILPREDTYIACFVPYPDDSIWTHYISSNAYMRLRIGKNHQIDVSHSLDFVTPDAHPIPELAREFRRQTTSDETLAQAIVDYVNSEYQWSNHVEDKTKNDVTKFPVETMVERLGNCQDLSILGASIMRAAGLRPALLHMSAINHMAIGVPGSFEGFHYELDGRRFYYAEVATKERGEASKRTIGEIAEKFGKPRATIYRLK